MRLVGGFVGSMTWQMVKEKILRAFEIDVSLHSESTLVINNAELGDIGETLQDYINYRPSLAKATIRVCVDEV